MEPCAMARSEGRMAILEAGEVFMPVAYHTKTAGA